MSVFAQVWFWALLAFLVGALLTWVLLVRPDQRRNQPAERQVSRPVQRKPTGGDVRDEPSAQASGPAAWPGEPGEVPIEEADAGRPRTRWLEQDSLRGMSTQVGGYQQQPPPARQYPMPHEQRQDFAPGYPPQGGYAQNYAGRPGYGTPTPGQGYVQPPEPQRYAEPEYVEEQRTDTGRTDERYAEDQYPEEQQYAPDRYPHSDYVEGEGVEEYRTAGASEAVEVEGYLDHRQDQTVGGADLFGAEDSGQVGSLGGASGTQAEERRAADGYRGDLGRFDDFGTAPQAPAEEYLAPQQSGLFEPTQEEAQEQIEYPAESRYQNEALFHDEAEPSAPAGLEPPTDEAAPTSDHGAGASLPKRQRGATNRIRGGFEPPRPIQPSVRPVLRRTPQDSSEISSGSLFEPVGTQSGDQGGHHQAPPARSHPEESSVPPGPFGPGSAMPLQGGGRPGPGFTVKASVTALRYCSEDSPQFPRMVAEVWFATPADAERVGFRPLT